MQTVTVVCFTESSPINGTAPDITVNPVSVLFLIKAPVSGVRFENAIGKYCFLCPERDFVKAISQVIDAFDTAGELVHFTLLLSAQ